MLSDSLCHPQEERTCRLTLQCLTPLAHLNCPPIPAPAARPLDPSLQIGKSCSALHAGHKAVASLRAKFHVAAFPDPGKHFLICEGCPTTWMVSGCLPRIGPEIAKYHKPGETLKWSHNEMVPEGMRCRQCRHGKNFPRKGITQQFISLLQVRYGHEFVMKWPQNWARRNEIG